MPGRRLPDALRRVRARVRPVLALSVGATGLATLVVAPIVAFLLRTPDVNKIAASATPSPT